MVLGAVPASSGSPAVAPIELPPLLAKLDVEAVADADIPLPSARPPATDRQVRALLRDETIARAYLGTDPATASAADRPPGRAPRPGPRAGHAAGARPRPARPASTRLDTGPLLRLVGGALMLLALAAGAGAVTARRTRTTDSG
jgi:hypothetical protein